MFREKASLRAVIGSVVAVGGVALLFLQSCKTRGTQRVRSGPGAGSGASLRGKSARLCRKSTMITSAVRVSRHGFGIKLLRGALAAKNRVAVREPAKLEERHAPFLVLERLAVHERQVEKRA